jgi:hypothetical protein
MPDMPNSTECESTVGESTSVAAAARKTWSTPRVISSSAVTDDTMKFPEHESLSSSVHLS